MYEERTEITWFITWFLLKAQSLMSKNYSSTTIRRSCFFFYWNDDPLELLEEVRGRWRTFKMLSGLPIDAYEKNTPKDGVVDRFQVAYYPSGGGGAARHADPSKNQKVLTGAAMSKRGVDFQSGGFFCLDTSVVPGIYGN